MMGHCQIHARGRAHPLDAMRSSWGASRAGARSETLRADRDCEIIRLLAWSPLRRDRLPAANLMGQG